jgi:hypothetical protein
MRKLGRTSSDALELLLDTVCSMFGAILLIAILVALMAQTAKVESSSDEASAEMLQRKIATAEADLAETHRITAELTAPSDSPATDLVAEKQKVEQALAAARAQRDRMSTELQDHVARQTVDFSTEWKKLTADLRALERKQEDLSNAIKSQDQNSARVNGRVAEISKLIQKEKDVRVVTLRFPKERARTKRSLPIICKFGKIYPIMDAEGRKNDTSIAWTSKGRDAELSRPVEALGWTPAGNKAAIDNLLRSIPKGEIYLAFYVYPDSFDAFNALREQAAAAQLDFGVQLERAGSDLIWSSEGSSPPPL